MLYDILLFINDKSYEWEIYQKNINNFEIFNVKVNEILWLNDDFRIQCLQNPQNILHLSLFKSSLKLYMHRYINIYTDILKLIINLHINSTHILLILTFVYKMSKSFVNIQQNFHIHFISLLYIVIYLLYFM